MVKKKYSLKVNTVCLVTLSVLQDLIPDFIPSQKRNMNVGLILNSI